jgi:hypothetical protein
MKADHPFELHPHACRAIQELDHAISSHSFRPLYVLAGMELRMALNAVGRLTSMTMKGVWEHNAWLLDHEIVVLEHHNIKSKEMPHLNDHYGFQIRPEPSIDYGTA